MSNPSSQVSISNLNVLRKKENIIESQEINSESENDNGFEEDASIYNRTESEIDLSTENLQEVESDLTYMATSTTTSTAATSTATSIVTSHESSWVWKFFSKDSGPSIEDEITRYITAPVTSDTNPLDWWYHYKDDFPVLATMASCYLSIQGSSIPSEQAFLIAANVITKIRCNLKPESAHAVMRLKSWIPKIRDKQDNENDLDMEILSES
ncbi:zinc finger bed domain-containing protein 1-like [Gigaspora margarita]|uniref:Zinc finger bed domain-containing protein 1-like n=1 Tax=Gigaspora margarita TaxID=4874 RepID=A0A8H4AUL9_GIGMA|nr:zinc finger bed domain-containing protein 1-like [Gigaspora margarita]